MTAAKTADLTGQTLGQRSHEIQVRGVRVHNLQNINLTIPHGQWLTLCGRSGSGKSSLAIDTLYAEGQRRYIESFSAYTRQYLNAFEKPAADEINGIPPSIAVTRSSRGLTGRATIGSNTEILDYLREVFAKLAQPICRNCQRPVRSFNSQHIVASLQQLEAGQRAVIGFTWAGSHESWPKVAAHLLANGFTRVSRQGEAADLAVELHGGAMMVQETQLENSELPLMMALESFGWSSVLNPLMGDVEATIKPDPNSDSVSVDSYDLPKRRATPRPATGMKKKSAKKKVAKEGAGGKKGAAKGTAKPNRRKPPNANGDKNPRADRKASRTYIDVIVDRFVTRQTPPERLIESLETALALGGRAFIFLPNSQAELAAQKSSSSDRNSEFKSEALHLPVPSAYRCLSQWGWRFHFGEGLQCDGCNQEFPHPTPALFSYNSPVGACPTCEGFGSVSQYDIRKIVPDVSKALRDKAIAPWSTPKYLKKWRKMMPNAAAAGLPLDKPFEQLTSDQVELLWQGSSTHRFPGLNGFFRWMEKRKYKMHYRIFMARWRSYFDCPDCLGLRLNPAARQFRIDGRSLPDACGLRLEPLQAWLQQLPLDTEQQKAVRTVMPQVLSRLQFLIDVGLPYVTLDRGLRTLSGGELQRTALTTALGSALVNLLYVLDEPSVGLHPRDIERLTAAIQRLHRAGNTVITVEHEVAMLAAADRIIEIGPGAGANGGQIVFDGNFEELKSTPDALTAKYLGVPDNKLDVRSPTGWIELYGASGNNLKAVDVSIPTGVMCVVTGVSGSGKSSLIRRTLVPALQEYLGDKTDVALPYRSVKVSKKIAALVVIDGSPIGRSPRSNPVTYLKAFDPIRKLFAETTEARGKNLTAGSFSFNVSGGRCEKCEGDGRLTIDMQFLPDISMTCPECHGKRYQKHVLEVTVGGKNIDDVLQMTVREAFLFFRNQPVIQQRLKSLLDVGLDYLALGQGAPTLSSGESQRLKLAAFLGGSRQKPTLFVLDEPTTGLHPADIEVLLRCFDALISVGHSLLIIEHNMQLMAAADYLIDIGPDAADGGGEIVVAGPPSEVANCQTSKTGRFLSS